MTVAFPSLGRQWLFAALKRFGFGYFNAVAALYGGSRGYVMMNGSLHFLCSISSGVTQGCPPGTAWAVAMNAVIRALANVVPYLSRGLAAGCADDLAVVLRHIRYLPRLVQILDMATRVGNLSLQPKTCIFIPLWAELRDEPKGSMLQHLRVHAPDCQELIIADVGKHLGLYVRLGAINDLQWGDTAAKWWQRLTLAAAMAAPVDVEARLYATSCLIVLSYMAPLPKERWPKSSTASTSS
ncbi:unnamed protein product [Prorocentrum cordatum]|uniref:Reverse transcriptase domain-containing protein n=1 Tax=Prorocentrum cordatum TaxID=2364126 RepID=A0ABN9UD34_9DINO|nr:unnamed protein product [Polarella glacialis]